MIVVKGDLATINGSIYQEPPCSITGEWFKVPLMDLLNNPGTLSSSSRPQIQVLPRSAICLCYVHSVALAAIAGWDFDGNIKQCFRLELYPERLISPSVPSCF